MRAKSTPKGYQSLTPFISVDAAFRSALSAGATQETPVEDQFWGDRMGGLTDPLGYRWKLSQNIEDLTGEQIETRMRKGA